MAAQPTNCTPFCSPSWYAACVRASATRIRSKSRRWPLFGKDAAIVCTKQHDGGISSSHLCAQHLNGTICKMPVERLCYECSLRGAVMSSSTNLERAVKQHWRRSVPKHHLCEINLAFGSSLTWEDPYDACKEATLSSWQCDRPQCYIILQLISHCVRFKRSDTNVYKHARVVCRAISCLHPFSRLD
eukprot:5356410-Amphidinium_carterae.1